MAHGKGKLWTPRSSRPAPGGLTRRSFLTAGAAALAAGTVLGRARSAYANATGLPEELTGKQELVRDFLPTPDETFADDATMVGFGPRYTGSAAHKQFLGWLEEEYEKNGVNPNLTRRQSFDVDLWEVTNWSLDVLTGSEAGPVKVAAYWPRSGDTGPEGVTGKLIYLGPAPLPSLSGDFTDAFDLRAAIDRYQRELADWMTARINALGEEANGAIVLVDNPLPPPLTQSAIGAATSAYYGQFAGGPFWVTRPWKKLWLASGVSVGTEAAAGVVYIIDASYEALAGNYAPFGGGFENVPALYVDRDEGARLRKIAQSKPDVKFALYGHREQTTTESFVTVLESDSGSDEVMILNTHSDGTNFAEENGTLGLLELCRYFNKLKQQGRGLNRSLVFSNVTGHFHAGFPQTRGFIDANPDLIARASHGMTIEHIGCTEWFDDHRGYYPTGLPEPCTTYHNEELLFPVFDSLVATGLQNHALSKATGSVIFGVGGALHEVVPSVSFIAGPTYLVANGPTQDDGVLDKLDPLLQARQVAWFADMLHRFDKMPKA